MVGNILYEKVPLEEKLNYLDKLLCCGVGKVLYNTLREYYTHYIWNIMIDKFHSILIVNKILNDELFNVIINS